MKQKRYKGHCMLCAWNKGTVKHNGADGVPWAVKRQLGRKRRLR